MSDGGSQNLSARGRSGLLGTLGVAFAAVAIPKCPLCIAAYLTAFGMSAGIASRLASWLLPVAWCAAGGTAIYVGLRLFRLRSSVASTSLRSGRDCCH